MCERELDSNSSGSSRCIHSRLMLQQLIELNEPVMCTAPSLASEPRFCCGDSALTYEYLLSPVNGPGSPYR